MQRDSKKNTADDPHFRVQRSVVLCTLVSVFFFAALSGCSSPGLFTILNEDNMTKEEIRDANAITLQNYYKEIGFTSSGGSSQEASADTAARAFAYADDHLIVSIEGGFAENGISLLLKVTDSKGQVFDIFVYSSGVVERITDAEGTVVYFLIL